MLVHNVSERNEAAKRRMRALLYFLKEETFSDFRTLKRVVGYKGKHNHAMYNLLNKAVSMGLLNKHEYPVLTGKKSLWGITMQGLAMVVSANDRVFPAYFEPGKLKNSTLEHRLLNQRVRIALEEKGGTGWLNGDRGEFMSRYPGVRHRPDGIITLSSGAIVAVETERTMKTRARYISIINSHLAASDAGRWHYAMYVMPDDKTKESLVRLFGSIRTVMRNSVPVPFDVKNREMFIFRTLDELENSVKDKQGPPPHLSVMMKGGNAMHDILTHGDCLDVLRNMPGNSVDSIVTDPPYGIKFMGKTWDYDVPSQAIWKECLRVLKPGGHLLSFAGSRTQHRMAVRIEDAGFEIRDMIVFLYETSNAAQALIESLSPDQLKLLDAAFGRDGMLGWVYGSGFPKSHHALKPALEPITLARKPFRGSIASNVYVHGTGALSISECRIPLAEGESPYDYPNGPGGSDPNHMWRGRNKGDGGIAKQGSPDGRWPANLIHDGSDAVLTWFRDNSQQAEISSASRFFYCAKASRKDRGEGNNHPCVKPTELMRYICRLVTPLGGTVLDPFMGSGSTGKAAAMEGFSFIGIEREEDYVKIARRRIAAARSTTARSDDAGRHIDN